MRIVARLTFVTAAIALLVACGGARSAPRGAEPAAIAAIATAADEGSSPGDRPGTGPDTEESPAPGEFRFRGIWVLCEGSERVLADPGRVDTLIERALALGVTDLFVQVYRGGRAWYASSLADSAPYDEIVARTGTDVFAYLVERAHAADLRVHAWVNVLSLNANRDAPILQALGRAALMVDTRGRSVLDYPGYDLPAPDRDWYRMGTPGLYLDPGAPGVRERLVATFGELLANYPGLDGLHLDYIRHPGVLPFVPGSRFGVGLDFGYGEGTRARFRRDVGVPGPYAEPGSPATSGIVYSAEWDDWRRDQVTALVSEIRTTALAAHENLLISAAVIPYADRAYLSLAQDWRGWLEGGLVDFAVPMVYTLDDRLLRHQVASLTSGPHADRIWIGLGTWLFAKDPNRAVAQLGEVAEAHATGEVLFSYDSIAASPALLEALLAAPGTAP